MPDFRNFSFDAEAFALVVHTKRYMAGKDLRTFGVETGIGYSALFRIEAKQTVGVQKFLTLCCALGEDPLTFLLDENGKRVPRKTLTATEFRNCNMGAAV